MFCYTIFGGYNTPIGAHLLGFFFLVCSMIVWVVIMVSSNFILAFSKKANKGLYFRYYKANNFVELRGIWTPMFILSVLSYVGYHCLITMEPFKHQNLTVKVIGYQWYWKYEIQDLGFDWSVESRLKKNSLSEVDMLDKIDWWLYFVDNPLILPFRQKIQAMVMGGDVIHSWAIPALGVKMDGVPGMSNCFPMAILRPGIYLGMCSELCGSNHSQMPIFIEAVNEFDWKSSMKGTFVWNFIESFVKDYGK